MKYIRTKDEIWELKHDTWLYIETKPRKVDILMKDDNGDYVKQTMEHSITLGNKTRKKEVIKEADTIEELCDEFVVVRDNQRPIPLINLEQVKLNRGNYGYSNSKVYGAIWNDKGLIYVAKMNDKGELELL